MTSLTTIMTLTTLITTTTNDDRKANLNINFLCQFIPEGWCTQAVRDQGSEGNATSHFNTLAPPPDKGITTLYVPSPPALLPPP